MYSNNGTDVAIDAAHCRGNALAKIKQRIGKREQ
jgi:hypothetical protein